VAVFQYTYVFTMVPGPTSAPYATSHSQSDPTCEGMRKHTVVKSRGSVRSVLSVSQRKRALKFTSAAILAKSHSSKKHHLK